MQEKEREMVDDEEMNEDKVVETREKEREMVDDVGMMAGWVTDRGRDESSEAEEVCAGI